MTALPDRPNTALLVIDVQNGVVAGAHHRDDVIATIDALVGKARAAGVPVVWVQHSSDAAAARQRGLAVRAGAGARRVGAARPQERTATPSRTPTSRPCSPSAASAGSSSRRADRRVHPLDAARRLRPRLRRDAGRRRAHDRGPDRVRRPAAGAGDRAHQPVLAVGSAPGPPRRTVDAADVSFRSYGPPQTLAPIRFRAPSPDPRAASARDRWRPPRLDLAGPDAARAAPCCVRSAWSGWPRSRRWSPASPIRRLKRADLADGGRRRRDVGGEPGRDLLRGADRRQRGRLVRRAWCGRRSPAHGTARP